MILRLQLGPRPGATALSLTLIFEVAFKITANA